MERRYVINNKEIMKSWNWEKNKEHGLDPEKITEGSNRIVYWYCPKGHNWSATVSSRIYTHNGCPICSHRKVLKGFNDLETTHPELIKEWHSAKNNKKPSEVMPGSQMKFWWRCNKGHEWIASVNNRVRGTRCPYCRIEERNNINYKWRDK